MKRLKSEEALEILDGMKVKIEIPKAAVMQYKRNAALDMAIEALKCSEIPNCSDTISRQAAIDALDKRFDSIPMEQTVEVLQLRRDLRELPPAQSEPHWIPCSERLPEEDHWLGGSGRQFSDEVLVSVANYDDEDIWTYISQTIDGEWTLELPGHCKIVAWMPLPEPYAEKGKNENQN